MSFLELDDGLPAERIRRLIPAGSVVAATMAMLLPLPLAWGVMPHVALLLVIIWASLQPRLMPTWAGFLLGLFFDLMTGLPFGLTALLFAGTIIAVRLGEARVEGHSLTLDWLFASILIVSVQLLTWQLLGFTGSAAPLAPLLAQAILTIGAYPLVATIAARIQRRLIDIGS